MKKLITYLKALWSSGGNSQSSDVGYDCRSTVVRPSFDCRSTLLKLVTVLVLILTVGVGNVWADNFSWDLTANSSSSASTASVTWTNAAASMVLTKGSGTNANNYLGGVSGHTHTRMYNNNVLTFTPNAGTTISSVVITCSGSSKVSGFNNNTWSNASKSISGAVATITPTNGANEFSCTISATVEVYTVAVTYTSSGGGTVTDAITASDLAASGTTYTTFSNVAKASDARYAGKSSKNNGGIQIRASGSDCGLVSTTSGGTIVSISVDWNSGTADGRTIDIYGKNTAYSAASDLFGDNKGTKLGSIVYGTSTELVVSGSYSYIGLRSNSNALAVDKIYIVWSTGASTTYNVYLMSGCTGGSYSSNKGTSGSGAGVYSSCTKYSGISSGTSVTITASPTSGYQFDGWTSSGSYIIVDDEGEEITPSSSTSTTATFTMPSSDVVIWQCNFSETCSANPTVGNAANNGALVYSTNPMTVPVTCPSIGAGSSCSIKDYGFVWNSGSNPTISTNKTQIGTDNHSTAFSGNISGTFAAGTTYFVKAYAINNGDHTTLSSGTYSFTPRSITMNSNGGSAVATILVLSGTAATQPADPTMTGYTFAGWYSNEELTTAVNWSSTIGSNKTYYAKWTAKQCTVNFDIEGGTGTITSVTATYGQAMPSKASNLPTKTGYDFAGFWDGDNGTGTQYYNADGTSKINWNKDVNATQTLYAKWTAKSYTVTWKVNNENYSAGGQANVTHGSHITTLPTAPNRPTYGCGDVFVGWTNVQNYVHGTSPLYTTADDFPNATGEQIFYAVYADYTTD